MAHAQTIGEKMAAAAAATAGWAIMSSDDLPYEFRLLKQSEIAEANEALGQRPPNQNWIVKMLKSFDPLKFMPLVVAKVKGYDKFQPVDGGHRKYLAMAKNPNSLIPALVLKTPITAAQNALLVVDLNKERKTFGSIEVFNAQVIGQLETAVGLRTLFDKYGITTKRAPRLEKNITATAAVEGIYNEHGSVHLDDVLGVVMEAYGGHRTSLKAVCLGGLSLVLVKNQKHIDRRRLVRVLKTEVSLATLKDTGANSRGDWYRPAALHIVRKYNTNLPRGVKKIKV